MGSGVILVFCAIALFEPIGHGMGGREKEREIYIYIYCVGPFQTGRLDFVKFHDFPLSLENTNLPCSDNQKAPKNVGFQFLPVFVAILGCKPCNCKQGCLASSEMLVAF